MNDVTRMTMNLLLLMLPMLAAEAQELVAEEEPEIRHYTVEMIIFTYAQEVSSGTEIFVGDQLVPQDLPVDDDIMILSEPEEAPAEEVADEEELPIVHEVEFTLLEEDEFTMGDVMGHLRRLDVYKPVMHFGWTQATWPKEETRAIELASLARPPPGLDASFKLYLSRFLHLVVDMQLDAPGAADTRDPAIDDSVASYGDLRSMDDFGSIAPPTGPVRYRIEEDRIFRSGELRYFDHPKFGVLAKVTRVEEEEEASLPQDTELLGYPAE